MEKARWYVAHTYSGYENKVKADIEQTIENRKLHDQILEVSVPMEEDIEVKPNGEKKQVQRKIFPGYVLVKMIMNDDTWYVVRNTRGVTGFVGPGSKPVPLTDQEIENMGLSSVKESKYKEGDTIVVTKGIWEKKVGVVEAVDDDKKMVTISIEVFGRETPTQISFADIKMLD
ncbi:MAG: transcription termination/antitermination protein NusG [Lachnospiraceae bacterium]